MKLYVSEFSDQGLKAITLTHAGESMSWEARPYGRASRIEGSKAEVNPNDDLVFREINAFLDTLPGERQQRIWEAYQEIFELFEGRYDVMALQSRLQVIVKKIYDEIPYEELHTWASMSSMIRLPLNLKTEYGENDPVDLTYLRQDYFDLAVLAVAARPMVPIWGEFIARIKEDVDTTFKEYVAVKLLYRTYITSCEPYNRLRRYIEASISNKAKTSNLYSAMLSGLSSSNIPDWLLANTLVRRTSVVPIWSGSEGPNIITDVYQYVNNTLRSPGHRRFSGPISDKQVRKNENADQQESLAESYKIKQPVSDGDVRMANAYAQNPKDMALAIDPTLDPAKLDICLTGMSVMEAEEIQPHAITLTQWVIPSVMSMHYVPLLNKSALLNVMAVVQALLWHWEYYDLAALLTAREVPQSDEFVSAQESRSKITNELMDVLLTIYPNPYPVKGKVVSPRQSNPGSRSVDALYALIAASDWYLNAPKELIHKADHVEGSRRMYVPADIRIQLARLLIHLYHQRLAFAERKRLRREAMA